MPRKPVIKKDEQSFEVLFTRFVTEIEARLEKIEVRLERVEAYIDDVRKAKEEAKKYSIQRVETFNNEEVPPMQNDGLRMNYEDRLQSMKNAIAILAPNFAINGRHTRQNIEAIVGFKVTDEMVDAVYATMKE